MAKQSKTEFILSYPTDIPAQDIVKDGAAKKLVFSGAYVYSVRSKAAKKEAKPAAAAKKRGRPAAARRDDAGPVTVGAIGFTVPKQTNQPSDESRLELAIIKQGTLRTNETLGAISSLADEIDESHDRELVMMVLNLGTEKTCEVLRRLNGQG